MIALQQKTLLPRIHQAVHSPLLELIVGSLMVVLAATEIEDALATGIISFRWHHGAILVGVVLVAHAVSLLLEGSEFLNTSSEKLFRRSWLRRIAENPVTHLVLGISLAISGLGECATAVSYGNKIRLLHFGFIAAGLSIAATSIVTVVQASGHLLKALQHSPRPLPKLIPLVKYLNSRLGCPVVRALAGTVLIGVSLFEEMVEGSLGHSMSGDAHLSLLLLGGLQALKSLPSALQKIEFVERAVDELIGDTSSQVGEV